jgi:asparagine synthase (glutamine-hydrolysing)
MIVGFLVRWSEPAAPSLSFLEPSTEVPTGQRPPLVTLATDERTATTVAFLGCLNYRDDLRARLALRSVGLDASDADYVLAAYLTGGDTALERLEGEFALVVWDGRSHRLIGLRDPFGAWPLYWAAGTAGVSVGTSLDALSRDLGARDIDTGYLANYLMFPGPGAEIPVEKTVFTGVRRLLPGVIMTVPADGIVRTRQVWDWGERIGAQTAEPSADAAGRVGALLRAAVADRLRHGAVIAHLSGGLDSSAVACLAAGGVGQLRTLSLVYGGRGLASERPYIDAVLRTGVHLVPEFVDGDDLLDYDWFERGLPDHDEPFGGLSGYVTQSRLTDAAAQTRATTVLTGFGSDELFDTQPHYLADLLRQGRLPTAWREASRWAGAWNAGIWSVLHAYGLKPLLPAVVGIGTGRCKRWDLTGAYAVPPWVRPEFERRHDMGQFGREHARRIHAAPAERSLQLHGLSTSVGDWTRWFLAAPRGLRLTHPFRDPRLACYVLALPASVRGAPGKLKPLLQSALVGVLPEDVRTRQHKRGFDEVYGAGLVRHLPGLQSLVERSAVSELGLFDSAVLLDALRASAAGVGDLTAHVRVDKSLALIAWFDQATTRPAREQKSAPCTLGHLLSDVKSPALAGYGIAR